MVSLRETPVDFLLHTLIRCWPSKLVRISKYIVVQSVNGWYTQCKFLQIRQLCYVCDMCTAHRYVVQP